jgi:hypothetical protein
MVALENNVSRHRSHIVISPLYGFALREGVEQLQFGDFTICDKKFL